MPDQSVLVINTGPLIALVAAVGDLTVLKHLYLRVIVPHEVCLEILAAGDDGFAAPQFSAASWLERLESPRQISQYLSNSLDRGEASVIQTALDLGLDTVCIDEAIGRRVARLNGLKLTGSLGVLIRARREGVNISITEAIVSMRRNGIWISDQLANLAIKEAGE
jgi:predicted nucleic acid-binding protein